MTLPTSLHPSTASTGFSSVKLPAALVTQAREAAQPLRRSVAGQIEYWATLGRIIEHTGLTAQEAQTAIEAYETSAKRTFLASGKNPVASPANTTNLQDLKRRVLAASTNGSLQNEIRHVVEGNRQRAKKNASA